MLGIKVFSIPIVGGEEANNELNSFLSSHRIADIEQAFSSASGMWTYSIRYIVETNSGGSYAKKAKVDYRQALSPDDFEIFDTMRRARKLVSDSIGMPPYVILNDEEMSKFVLTHDYTIKTLGSVPNVGEAKAEKYGKCFLDAFFQLKNEKSVIGEVVEEAGGFPSLFRKPEASRPWLCGTLPSLRPLRRRRRLTTSALIENSREFSRVLENFRQYFSEVAGEAVCKD